jgi:hypothetical protein
LGQGLHLPEPLHVGGNQIHSLAHILRIIPQS